MTSGAGQQLHDRAASSEAAAIIVTIGALTLGLGLLIGAAVVGEPILAIAGFMVVLLGFAALADPNVATLVVIFLIYSNAAVVAVTVHGAPFIVAASVPVLLFAPLAYYIFMRREPIVVTPALPFILAYFVVQLVSAFLSADPRAAAADIAIFVTEGLGIYLLVTNVIRTPEMLRRVIWVLVLVGAFLGSVSLVQQLTGTADNAYFGFGQTDSSFGTGNETLSGEVRQARLAGPIGEQNRYAQVMLMLVPLGFMQLWAERRLALRAILAVSTLLAALGSTLGFSRGAFVGFALLVLAMTALRYIRIKQLAAIAAGVLIVAVTIPQVGARLQTFSPIVAALSDEAVADPDNAVLSRVTENIAALLVLADHPVVGVGPGLFPLYYRQYAAEVGILTKAEDREAHNLYLDVAADTGLLGLGTFMGAIIVTLRSLARGRRRWLTKRPDLALNATGFGLALFAYLTTGLFLHLSYARYFWLMLALAGVAAFMAAREAERAAAATGATARSRLRTQPAAS